MPRPDAVPDPQPAPPLDDRCLARARELGLGRWPDVMADLAAGRGFAAHATLRRIVRSGPAGGERDLAANALRDPRLFAEPVRSAPGLGRLNGFGVGMYGASDVDPADGSYVKTRWASAVWIPVVPIDQWLVRDAQGRGWYFLARVPLSPALRKLRLALCAVAVLAAASIASVAAWRSSHTDLWVLNELDVPADVRVDESTVTVRPHSRARLSVAGGSHHLRCTVNGRVVDERDATIDSESTLAAYNVCGAALLYMERVVYVPQGAGPRSGGASDPASDVSVLAGDVLVQRRDVDYAFRAPPSTVSLRNYATSKSVRHADVAGGWKKSLRVLTERGLKDAAVALAEQLALALPDDAEVVERANEVLSDLVEPTRHLAFCERLVSAAPDSAAAQLALQDARIVLGEDAALVAGARAWKDAHPDDPRALALWARVAPGDEGPAAADLAVSKAGADPLVRVMAFKVHYRCRRWADAAKDAALLVAHALRTGAAAERDRLLADARGRDVLGELREW